MFRYDAYQIAIMTESEKAKALSEEWVSLDDLRNPTRLAYLTSLGLKSDSPQARKRGRCSERVPDEKQRMDMALKERRDTFDADREAAEESVVLGCAGWTVSFFKFDFPVRCLRTL